MVTKKSASSASVSILSVQNENGASFVVVVFRVVVDPSPFSPSFPFSFSSHFKQRHYSIDDGAEKERVQPLFGKCFLGSA